MLEDENKDSVIVELKMDVLDNEFEVNVDGIGEVVVVVVNGFVIVGVVDEDGIVDAIVVVVNGKVNAVILWQWSTGVVN